MARTYFPVLRMQLAAGCLSIALTGCTSDLRDDPPSPAREREPLGAVGVVAPDAHDIGADSRAPDGRPSLCARPGNDLVRDVFCGATQPTITSLRALQDQLRLNPLSDADTSHANDMFDTVPVAVLLAYSTALSGQLVSPINPRAIVIGREAIMAFQRGVQQVEVVSRARGTGHFNFYLLSFEQACNARPEGCRPGDLYTPEVERGWTRIALQDDTDLANTPSDCRLCHQRGGDTPVLLMRELESPWTHFFERDTSSGVVEAPGQAFPDVRGRDLLRDYVRAKGDEPYAELSLQTIEGTIAFALQNVVPQDQPLLFDAPRIEDERWPYGPTGYARTARVSDLWARSYAAFKRGEQLPLPHFAPRPTDPEKQARLTDAYRRYREGTLAAAELPDFADVYPDDPQLRAELGFQVEPGATPAEALIQACGVCHNDVLDQSLSRARFNIALSRMTPAQRMAAVARLELAPGAHGVMPPRDARQLDEDARARLVAYLRQPERAQADDALLDRAAKLGMNGREAGTRAEASAYPMGTRAPVMDAP
ncbi:MAG: hypothetical protein ABW252_00815 [Polyangiales bacterium]